MQRVLRGLTGHVARWSPSSCARTSRPPGPQLLGQSELIERLRAEFAAEEVFDEEER